MLVRTCSLFLLFLYSIQVESATFSATAINFKWSIDAFSVIAARGEEPYLESHDFKIAETGAVFNLRFYPTSYHNNLPRNHSGLFLIDRDLNGMHSIIMKYKMWLENKEGEKIMETDFKNKFLGDALGWGDFKFIHHEQIYGDDEFVRDNCLIACFELDWFILHKTAPPVRQIDSDEAEICSVRAGNYRVKLPKQLLSNKSVVLNEMLEEDDDSTSCSIKFQDVTKSSAKAFTEFLTTHIIKDVDKMDNEVEELFIFSNNYGIDKLIDMSADNLSKKLNSYNLFSRLRLAFLYNHAELKEETVKFATDPNNLEIFNDILESNEWKQLLMEKKDVADEIYKKVYQENENTIDSLRSWATFDDILIGFLIFLIVFILLSFCFCTQNVKAKLFSYVKF